MNWGELFFYGQAWPVMYFISTIHMQCYNFLPADVFLYYFLPVKEDVSYNMGEWFFVDVLSFSSLSSAKNSVQKDLPEVPKLISKSPRRLKKVQQCLMKLCLIYDFINILLLKANQQCSWQWSQLEKQNFLYIYRILLV